MKQIFMAMVLATGFSYAQDYKTGDADFDANLKVVNTKAKENLSAFKAELAKQHNVALQKVEDCFKAGMNAGDAAIAFQIASIQNITVDKVITQYKANKSKGWGVMAKDLGIKPGSAEFHALKGKVKENGHGHHDKGNQGKSNQGKKPNTIKEKPAAGKGKSENKSKPDKTGKKEKK